jgi:hypothetical protein
MDTPNPQLSPDTRFIKRSKLSPWNTAAKEGSPAARQASSGPALTISDIPQTTPVPSTIPRGQVNGQQMRRTASGTPTPSATGSAKGDSDGQQKKAGTKLFSSHPKLQAMQKEWEKKDAEAKNAEAVARNKQQNVYNAPGAGEDDSDSTSTDSSSSDDETERDEEEPQELSKKVSLGPDTGEKPPGELYSLSASDSHLSLTYLLLPHAISFSTTLFPYILSFILALKYCPSSLKNLLICQRSPSKLDACSPSSICFQSAAQPSGLKDRISPSRRKAPVNRLCRA